MEIIRDIDACRSAISWRRAKRRVGFVPTMGNLHPGHLALINACREQSDLSVVSVYVNPLLPGAAGAPQNLDRDAELLDALSVDFLFAPSNASLFPDGLPGAIRLQPAVSAEQPADIQAETSAKLTVMAKLINILSPDKIFVGEMDYYLCVLLAQLMREFSIDAELCQVPVIREPDGVAAAADLDRLTAEQRRHAPILHQTLNDLAYAIRNGARNYGKLEQTARVALRGGGFDIEHVAIRDGATLEPPTEHSVQLRIIARAQLGMASMSDNLGVDLQ